MRPRMQYMARSGIAGTVPASQMTGRPTASPPSGRFRFAMAALLRTGILLAAITALFVGIGFAVGGAAGAAIAFLIALATNALAWWNSDRMVLSIYRARPATQRDAPELFGTVERLAERADLPMPAVYIIDSEQPNAFATGRSPNRAAVAATTGLLRTCSREEVAGVMAHELAHVKSRDTTIMTVTATLAGAIGFLSMFALFFGGSSRNGGNAAVALIVALLAPVAAGLVQMAISRTREYEADRIGAEICGNPAWLASALERLDAAAGRTVNPDAERHPATAHLFIVNPLKSNAVDSLFATHPKMADRIARLRAMAAADARPRTVTGIAVSVGDADAGADRRAAPTATRIPRSRRGPWG